MTFSDPRGFFLRNPIGPVKLCIDPLQGPGTLAFGDECVVRGGAGIPMTLRDPGCVRIIKPIPIPNPPPFGGTIQLGQLPDCLIFVDPLLPPGLTLSDPNCVRVRRPAGGGKIVFGDDVEIPCEIEALPGDPMTFSDPNGFFLRNPIGPVKLCIDPLQGPGTLAFGDLCTVQGGGGIPMTLLDPNCVNILKPTGGGTIQLGNGPQCLIFVDPALPPGLTLSDPTCVRVRKPTGGGTIVFGDQPDCLIFVDPLLPPGLTLSDPTCVRIRKPTGGGVIVFGDDLELPCSIVALPRQPMTLSDPNNFNFVNPTGPVKLCVDPTQGPGQLAFGEKCFVQGGDETGLTLLDPFCVNVLKPDGGGVIAFDRNRTCTVGVDPAGNLPGLIFNDPSGFNFVGGGFIGVNLNGELPRCGLELPQVEKPEGTIKAGLVQALNVGAQNVSQTSSRRFKENIKPITDALSKIGQLGRCHLQLV